MQYTLVGFYSELDWRPLNFLQALPTDKDCSACGVVRPQTVLLPCTHTLCDSCFKQCTDEDCHRCPLDGYQCPTKDVEWREFGLDELFLSKVKCWNEANGFQYATTPDRIARHFHNECAHHTIHCRLCSATVPYSSLMPHLRDCFRDVVGLPTTDVQGKSGYSKETALDPSTNETFRKEVEQGTGELEQLLTDIKAQGERLNQLSRSIKDFKRSEEHEPVADVGEHIESGSRVTHEVDAVYQDAHDRSERLERLLKSLKDKISDVESQRVGRLPETATATEAIRTAVQKNIEFSQKTLEHVKSVLRHIEPGKVLCVFSVKHVKALQKTAMETGVAKYESKPVYLRGYNVAPGVLVMKHGGYEKLYAQLRLYRGNMDSILRWPFEYKVRFGIMHPKNGPDIVFEVKENSSFHYFQRPRACSNSSTYFAHHWFNVEGLLRDGYVENDRLHIMFELLENV